MTQSNYYQLYIESVLQLAETIVIKSEETAQRLNQWVTVFKQFAVDTSDPRTWKYYLNISGQYHPTDEVMTVVSLDTLEEIVFSKEVLKVHRATKRGYAYGTREYRQLVSRYPRQEMLILGILYPVDIELAIAAKDLTILGYPSTLVEFNEYSLIANLQKWIDSYRVRWTNNQYSVSDDLYPAVSLGILYLQLVPTILNLRLQACKTNEAHSYHVREYLASHGLLDVYLDNLSIKQALWLYRNIAYIERNSGQQNVFEWLVEHIMTERHLPLAEYVMRHDLSKQPEQVYPTLGFKRQALNPPQSTLAEDTITLERLLLKQDALALGNQQERENGQAAIQVRFENSESNALLTKTLESSMIDYSNATPYILEEVLLNHWLWLSSNGYYYQAVVSITNPKTGERIPMMVKDAFVFMWYAFCASVDIPLQTIPQLYAKRVQRVPTPSVDEIMQVVTSVLPRSLVEQAHSWQPTIVPMISTEAFYDAGFEIYQAANWQRRLVGDVEHQGRRGMAMNAVEQLYSDNICQLAPAGYSYEQWFADRNIRISDFTVEDLKIAYVSIARDATGLSLHNTNSLRNLQRAMVNLLGQLSSYSVQFLADINSVDIRVGDAASIRVGDLKAHLSGELFAHSLVVEPVHLRSLPHRHVNFAVGGAGPGSTRNVRMHAATQLQLNVKPHSHHGPAANYHYRLDAAPVYVQAVTQAGPSQGGVIPVLGVDSIYDLTTGERDELRDVYRHWNIGGGVSTDLRFVVGQTVLPGFDWVALNLGVVVARNELPGFDWVVAPVYSAPVLLQAPLISGQPGPGNTVMVSSGTWQADGALSYSYQWQDNGSDIAGAADAQYLIPADGSTLGHSLTVVVTASAHGLATTTTAAALTVALPPAPPRNTVLPALLGIANPGNTLTASLGGWSANSELTYTLQWLANGVEIAGANALNYVIPNSAVELGIQLAVRVTAYASGLSTSATSAAMTVVAP